MKFKSVVATGRGAPDVLQVIEQDFRPPSANQVRIRVVAAPVSLPDVEARYGRSPFKIKTPFVPGYAVVGDVDAVGEAVTSTRTGSRVAVLSVYGGYTEYYYADGSQLIPVPAALDPVETAPLVSNYIVAYQTLYRYAKINEAIKS